ncbi:DUF1043 family protein [uncultured Gilliamella sp.]|jgi:Uncharacterized protein conserved in bacteria|uniref:YhcB family protein n=1 Tax=uncultured Gilliamella sp. TaxID=1193505 RepID=UPI0025F3623E|nr:DUF1043 family protein [uncultured Gilliamella sp.]
MDKDIVTFLIIGLATGFVIGLIFMSIISPNARKYTKAKKELEQTKNELNRLKEMITKHFSHSAEILDNMAKDFRSLYQHMAENSSQFIVNEDVPNLNLEANSDSNINNKLTFDKQPKDYSDNPSGLFKTDENKS